MQRCYDEIQNEDFQRALFPKYWSDCSYKLGSRAFKLVKKMAQMGWPRAAH